MADKLMHACRNGDATEVERLLLTGAIDVNAAMYEEHEDACITPLFASAMYPFDAKCASLLIEARANVHTTCGRDDETVMHVFCSRGIAEGVQLLIDAGASLDPVDSLGRSPLFYCALNDCPDCAEILLQAGAAVDQAMRSHNPGATPLYAAALTGSESCVSLLCEAKANVNASCREGANPMMVACEEGHLECAMLLSSYGAQRGRLTFAGCLPYVDDSAYECAEMSGNAALVSWLRESASFSESPLCHVEVLTPQRTMSLLRTGMHSPLSTYDHYSPVSLAQKHSSKQAASLILRAAAPWSPASHQLWGTPQRARARELLWIGYLLGSKFHDNAMLDIWVAWVIPHAVTWDL
jgi:hypothetical protein